METTKQKNMSVVAPLHTSANNASFSKRKSLSVQTQLKHDLVENNDEVERLNRRLEIISPASETSSTKDRRHSLGLGSLVKLPAPEITNRISECIKLNTENKINIKNAFSLEIIDFMTFMIKKQDSNMSNLQVASTSLDVSTKIYGLRVDGVHTEIMQMMGGLDKKGDGTQGNDTEDTNAVENSQEIDAGKPKKKRRKHKQQIFSTIDSLKGNIETAKPPLWLIGYDDLQTTDALYQVVMPNHLSSRFYMDMYNDITVDTIKDKTKVNDVKVPVPKVQEISELDLCAPLADFNFRNWINDCEEVNETESKKNNEENFQFNLDASIPSEDEVIHNSINYLDIPDEREENVETTCVQVQKPVEKMIDLRKVVTGIELAKLSEYSFLQRGMNIHWAGPSHWKTNNLTRLLGNSKIVETCQQERVRKKGDIELCYDDKSIELTLNKFSAAKNKSAERKTDWLEEMITLPRDMQYTIAFANKLYLHPLNNIKIGDEHQLDATSMSDVIESYNYNNENDVSNYCPDIPNDDYDANDDGSHENCEIELGDGVPGPQMLLTENNLLAAPKLTNKITVAYSVRAKKIDMRQLKKSIWQCMISNNDKENSNTVDDVQQQKQNEIKETASFSQVYKTLPNILTKTNADALSFPLAFVSLLHLVNEKVLKVETVPDMSDIIVKGD